MGCASVFWWWQRHRWRADGPLDSRILSKRHSCKTNQSSTISISIGLVKAGYEDLILLRDSLSPDTHLIFHAYDFAIPDGRGICFMGPWMKPTFDVRNFKTRAPATAVVKEMLQQFAKMLKKLERTHKNVTFIDTQGTLAASTRSWHNELHPSKSGFKKFAKLFHKQIKSKYPNRVL